MNSPVIAALIYDFDGTLAQGNMQEHSYMGDLGIDKSAFWGEVRKQSKENDADEILTYMRLMVERSKEKNKPITKKDLEKHGASVPLFEGLDSWFGRVNKYAEERNVQLEHYIISSGLLEMIKGCSIYKNFKKVFASQFHYDEKGEACWPAVTINYTTKMQFIFRINKGINNIWDNESVNRWIPMKERRIPFSRMIFIGDGDTDIPAMKMTRTQGGSSIGVFNTSEWDNESKRDRIEKLISEDRVSFVAAADYKENSQLDVTVKGIIGRIAREDAQYRPSEKQS